MDKPVLERPVFDKPVFERPVLDKPVFERPVFFVTRVAAFVPLDLEAGAFGVTFFSAIDSPPFGIRALVGVLVHWVAESARGAHADAVPPVTEVRVMSVTHQEVMLVTS